MLQILTEGCESLGICLTDVQKKQFEMYYKLLVEWNHYVNLTSITEYDDVMRKHFLDSLCIASVIDMHAVKSVVDIGTGAGFPGVPLKIVYPSIELTLLDSLNKRVKFLLELLDNLCLKSTTVIHGRAEEIGRNARHRESYDLCVSRAVAKMSVLSEYCIPLVHVGGDFVAYKSGAVQEELKDSYPAIEQLGGTLHSKEKFLIPCSDIERTLIHIKKIHPTPKRYPRKNGIPKKLPLGSERKCFT